MARLGPVDFEDRLTLVEHLGELRARIVVSLIAFAVAFGLCLWQNTLLLSIANQPLPAGFEPITFGVTEPFMTTLTVAAYAALVISLPVLLYQAYAFVLPALTKRERRVVVPFLLVVPFLFIGGVVFSYYVVVPAAVKFLLGFNQDEFNVQVRARDYYSFFALTLTLVGLLFQMPLGILAVTRLGIVSPEQLAKNRRYAILVIAVVAMLGPGGDPVTMLILMAPLILLFEGSLLLARMFGGPPEPEPSPEMAMSEPS